MRCFVQFRDGKSPFDPRDETGAGSVGKRRRGIRPRSAVAAGVEEPDGFAAKPSGSF
jgi:hypothetical protein